MKRSFRYVSLLTVLCCVMTIVPVFAGEMPITVTEIQKYGNLVLSVSGSEFLAMGYEIGDIITAEIAGQSLDMPVATNYADVEQGSMICRVVVKPESNEDIVILAINMGNFATAAGIAEKETIEEEPGYVWHYNEGIETPVVVSLGLKEKGGYLGSLSQSGLTRSENRGDYPDLTDAQYANFRAITTRGMGEGKLYRSSSPVNPEIGRNKEADAACAESGINSFINLADTESVMKAYEGYENSYYSRQSILPLNLDVDFSSDSFQDGMAKMIRFIGENESPFLVHCNEGKDRAGFASALLECLMGADAEEVKADYMVTFFNYYGVLPGTGEYESIVNANIVKSLSTAFGLDDLDGQDLAEAAQNYFLSLGLSQEEIDTAKVKLAN